MNQALKELKDKCTQSELALIEKAFQLSDDAAQIVSDTIHEFDKQFSYRMQTADINNYDIKIIKVYWQQSVDVVKEKLLKK